MTTIQAPSDIDAAIGNVLDIIVQGWDPLQIVLFGSRARGDHREDSDIDLLVVLEDCEDRFDASSAIRSALRGLDVPTDIVVTTPETLIKRAFLVGAVERRALIDGRIRYVRGGGDPVIEAALHQLQQAVEDLGAAEFLFGIEGQPSRHVCYWAHGATEKSLNAALELEHSDYPHTHKLGDLRSQLPPAWPVHELDLDLDRLSQSAVSARYPEVRMLPTRVEAVQAVADARLIVNAIVEEFQRRGHELP